MKGGFTVLAVLVLSIATVIADKKDFPAFDPNHAHCALETFFPDSSCSAIYSRFQ